MLGGGRGPAALRRLWGQVRSSKAKTAAAGVFAVSSIGALGLAGTSVYALKAVHASRPRGYSDEFVLTPEDLNMPYHEVQFFTEDGISLTGWFIPQSSGGRPSRRIIVCCHPKDSSKSNLLGVAHCLWEHRYSVFMFDFRSFAHRPTKQSIGYLEQKDARAAIQCARQHGPEGAAVGLIGASMGGAVALIVGHEQEPAVVGIATDCAFSGIADVLEARIGGALRLPAALSAAVTWVAGNLNPLLHGYSFREVAPVAAVAEGGSARAGQVPLLLIHAENDDVVPVSHAHAIFKAAAVPPQDKRLVVVQHCHHIGCFFRDRPGYKKLLTRFFDDAFARAEAESGAVASMELASRRLPPPLERLESADPPAPPAPAPAGAP